ncbi:MAG: HD domain-containing protein [Nitrosomonadales bacterium]|nr:HD domain-containing protein [Nitrosomonadales bacterium]
MKNTPTSAQINELFDNVDQQIVWAKANDIIRRMSPQYDFTLIQFVYGDVMRLFHGDYPGYTSIKTLYHDLPHTLEVLLCGARLMHGVHVSGDRLTDEEISLIMIAILMHDVGYAQRRSEESGTGAQHTQTHVQRGIEFMRQYFADHKLPENIPVAVTAMILGTEHNRPFAQICFSDERSRMLGRIVATADITGQMADRIYLEKLLFLYLEFKEANFGSYQSTYDLLCQTNRFYEMTREKLDGALGGIYQKLEYHFKDTMGVSNNYYLESIEKNMTYLAKVVAHDEAELYSLLKRHGVANMSRILAQSA